MKDKAVCPTLSLLVNRKANGWRADRLPGRVLCFLSRPLSRGEESSNEREKTSRKWTNENHCSALLQTEAASSHLRRKSSTFGRSLFLDFMAVMGKANTRGSIHGEYSIYEFEYLKIFVIKKKLSMFREKGPSG